MDSPLQALIAGFLIVVVGMSATMVLGTFAESTGIETDERIERQAAVFEGSDGWVQLGDGTGTNHTVYKTTGYAVELTGAPDSYVQSERDVEFAADDNWTVSVWAGVDEGSATAEMTAVDIDGRVLVTYDGGAGQWSAWYYDDGSTNSYVANVSTSGHEVGNLTNVQVRHNGTHLSIYRNGTLGETVATTGDSIQSAPVNATNWDGRLEELRTFDHALNSSERATLVDSPAQQLPGADPTARAMFDQPDRATQLLLYSGTQLETSNVTYGDGVPAQQMDGDGNLVGVDYQWESDGPQIAPADGGELDGAPVAYASYDKAADGAGEMLRSWGSFSEIMSTVPVLLGVLVILGLLARLRQ